ncbi:MAG: AmmeMemoRadiSam system radical SAM enzyme [bacterium]
MTATHPAILWDRLDGQQVRCRVCERRCAIAPGRRGVCQTRENRAGDLVTLIYGAVSCLHVAPVEAKPLYHFYPGSRWLSLGSLDCNFRCPGCQNWEIAHCRPGEAARPIRSMAPEEVAAMAAERGCQGLSWTYNEPTLWLEFARDATRLARRRGLMANFVTNGYITPEALDEIAPLLDAWRVDIKAFDADTYQRLARVRDFEKVLAAAERARTTHGLHVECVTNLVPGHNDDEAQLRALADWVAHTLGPGTPWHVTRFAPHADLADVRPTPVATLERARAIGREAGLWYVYIGNVPGHRAADTVCHVCGAVLVEREGMATVENRIWRGTCPFCSAEIPGRWA